MIDPRTPVLVGVGQVTNRPDPSSAVLERPGPVDLMARAACAAAEDCDGVAAGGDAPVGRRLLERASSLRVVEVLGWRTANPALAVADLLGISPGETVLTAIGGNMPLSLLHDAALEIARGRLDVVLVAGAEANSTRSRARRLPGSPRPDWPVQTADATPAPLPFGEVRVPMSDLEANRGVLLPIHAYPLIETALRRARGWSLDEHRARIGELWSRFSAVAATNPYAWQREALGAEEIMTPTAHNRMVATPYPKLCTANLNVDQAAAYLCCSVEAARAAGVPEERWVFPLAGAEADDHWFVSERPELDRSPAIRLAGERAFALAGVGVDDLGPVDLYSCFPCVVRVAARELGLPEDDPDRPLTLTGGLTFGGGPGNNAATHALAAAVAALRAAPGSVGLVTGLGWFATKHAVTVLASRPPHQQGRGGFRFERVQEAVDVLPTCPVDPGATGPVTVETYTVVCDRTGAPQRAIAFCRTPSGVRAIANVEEEAQRVALAEAEGIGLTGILDARGNLDLG